MPTTALQLSVCGIASIALTSILLAGVYGGVLADYFSEADDRRNLIIAENRVVEIALSPYCGAGSNLVGQIFAIIGLVTVITLNLIIALIIRLQNRPMSWWNVFWIFLVVECIAIILLTSVAFSGPTQNCFSHVVRSDAGWQYRGPTDRTDLLFGRFGGCEANHLPLEYTGPLNNSTSPDCVAGQICCIAYSSVDRWDDQLVIPAFNQAYQAMFAWLMALVLSSVIWVPNIDPKRLGLA